MRAGERVRRPAVLLALLLAVATLTGCATVPDSSPVQILRRVSDGDQPQVPPGPVEGSDVTEVLRGFVEASGASADQHAAARRFLTPEAAEGWDDTARASVVENSFDTVPVPDTDPSFGATVRRFNIRIDRLGQMNSSGAFETLQEPALVPMTVTRVDGQWRISELPDGVVVPLGAFQDNYRTVRTWFVDPTRRVAVPDVRHLPAYPAAAQPARVLQLLIDGPSEALRGSAGSMLPAGARLRSNLSPGTDGVLVVDLTGLGDLDDGQRRLLAAQIVLSLNEVNVERARLLVDGVPLLPDMEVVGRGDVAQLDGEAEPSADADALVVSAGRLRTLSGPTGSAELPGAVGNGTYDVESAASTWDGSRLAAVSRYEGRRQLLVGGGADGGVTPVDDLLGVGMTRPSWTPDGAEVWTVRDGTAVVRVLVDQGGAVRTSQVNADELVAFGPVQDLRLSRDGMRVAAVVGGRLHVGAIARTVDGEVAVRNIRQLRPADLGQVLAVDWRSADRLVVITSGPDRLVAEVAVDGLSVHTVLVNNLTPPLTSVAAAPSRSTLVTDASGVWSFAGGEQAAWRQVFGGAADAKPFYPG